MKTDAALSDWPRKNALNGVFDIVRTLKSLEECEQLTPAGELLEQLTRSINLHRRCLVRLEKYAYEMVAKRFDGYRSTSLHEEPVQETQEPPPLPPLPPPAPHVSVPTAAFTSENLRPLPPVTALRTGEKFRAAVQLAASPLEFYVVRCDHLVARKEMERALQAAPRQPSATAFGIGDVCAVVHENRMMRAEVRECGREDLLVSLIDRGSCHFISRKNAFLLSNEFREIQPFARFCSLADADSRKMDTASVMLFSRAISQTPEVIILACGRQRKSHGELVYILDEEDSYEPKRGEEQKPLQNIEEPHGDGGKKRSGVRRRAPSPDTFAEEEVWP